MCECTCAWACTVCALWFIAAVCLGAHQIFQHQKCGWLPLPWQPSSLQSRHWCRNTPPRKLCQWGYAKLRGRIFVNRDIQVKNCLFTSQLFFPLQRKKHKTRPADELQRADRLPGCHHQRWKLASRKSCTQRQSMSTLGGAEHEEQFFNYQKWSD